jgi:hypothetical protein
MNRRPTPEQTREIVRDLAARNQNRDGPSLVAAIRRETGCSRASGYRAVVDALKVGTIKAATPETDEAA